MIQYDDKGFIANRPVTPQNWKAVSPDMPEGVIIARNALPPGVLLIQNFLDAGFCDAIVRECEAKPRFQSGVGAGGDGVSMVRDGTRVSTAIDVRSLSVDLIGVVRETFAKAVAPHFRKEIEWFELPELLRYEAGGHYMQHADADEWSSTGKSWSRVLDRDLSILIYLNEGYQGGEIAFSNFGVQLQPKKGMLIAFPSDNRYLHMAREVKSGVRYALVSWAAVKGSARVTAGPRGEKISM